MEIESLYYTEKLYALFDKLFIDSGDARRKFINCEKQFSVAYDASFYDGVPNETREYWGEMWKDLNTKESLIMNRGDVWFSSFHQTIKSKRNKTLEKYLFFILEEYVRLNKAKQ